MNNELCNLKKSILQQHISMTKATSIITKETNITNTDNFIRNLCRINTRIMLIYLSLLEQNLKKERK